MARPSRESNPTPIKLTPYLIEQFSICPTKYHKTSNILPVKSTLNIDALIVSSIIKNTYFYALKEGSLPIWQQVIHYAEDTYKELSGKNLVPREFYLQIKRLLNIVNIWFTDIYSKYPFAGLIDLPIAIRLDYYLHLSTSFDLVTTGKTVQLWEFIDYKPNKLLLDSVEYQAKLLCFYLSSDILPTEYNILSIYNKNITLYRTPIDKKLLSQVEKNVRYILRGIKEGVSLSRDCSNCISKCK